jgi:hypothetical protein
MKNSFKIMASLLGILGFLSLANCKEEKDDKALLFGAVALASQQQPAAGGTPTPGASTFSIGGTITGLTAAGLVLQNNTADDLTVASGATSFTFATKVSGAYSVTVKTQPTDGKFCIVSNGNGTASTAVTNVTIRCNILMGGSVRTALNLTGAASVFAGPPNGTTTSGDLDGTGTAARFFSSHAMTTDGENLYVTDTGNQKIRKIVIATGEVSVFAGPANGTTTDGDTDGIGNAARFNYPTGITCDGANLYVAEANNRRIRRIVIATREVSSFVGPPQGSGTGVSGDVDGVGTAARFNQLNGITTDGTNLYVVDEGTNKIRKVVIATRESTVLAGPAAGTSTSGDVDGTGTNARFSSPKGITTDGTNLYVTEYTNNKVRKIVIATGEVSVFAGPAAGTTTSGDVEGTGITARFNRPKGITSDGTNLYLVDQSNHKVKKIVIATGAVSILAGPAAGTTTTGDVDGTGTNARFNFAGLVIATFGMACDGTSCYIPNFNHNRIHRIQ